MFTVIYVYSRAAFEKNKRSYISTPNCSLKCCIGLEDTSSCITVRLCLYVGVSVRLDMLK